MKKKYKLDISSLEMSEDEEGMVSLIALDDDKIIKQFKIDNHELIEKNKYNIEHNINEQIIVEDKGQCYLLKQYDKGDSSCNKCDFDCRSTYYCPLDFFGGTKQYYLEKKELFEIEFGE